MIQKAIDYLINLGVEKSPLVNVDGKTYSLKTLSPVKEVGPDALGFNFLDSLITYIKENVDVLRPDKHLIIEIKDPTEISLHTEIVGNFNQRFTPVQCTALVNEFPWSRFMSPEEFIIMTQSRFVETEDLVTVKKIAGNVTSEQVLNFSDDGVSQQVTAKSGIARVDNVVVPPKVKLAPYRTFLEIEQPESEFVFRAKKAGDLPHFALFEADGGAWRIEAMKRIKAYLEDNLKDIENVVVLG